MASSPCQEAMFHEESIRVVAITTAEDVSIHSTPFSSMSSIMNGEDVLLVYVHSEPSLEDGFSSHESIGSKDGEVLMSSEEISLLHTLFIPMYSSTMTSRVPSSSSEGGEAFSMIMVHLLGADYNLLSKLMLQEPYD